MRVAFAVSATARIAMNAPGGSDFGSRRSPPSFEAT
jgi:hypothetical protein